MEDRASCHIASMTHDWLYENGIKKTFKAKSVVGLLHEEAWQEIPQDDIW